MTEMRGVVGTQKSNFWKESLKKEAQLRKEWHLKYSKEFAKPQSTKRARQLQTMEFTPIVIPDPIRPATRPAKPVSAPHLADLADMRPATEHTQKILYQGISHHGEGRHGYV